VQSSSAPRWRSLPPEAIAVRQWDGEFVVRTERTGNSHLLGPLAGRVLEVLLAAGNALQADELLPRLGAATPVMEANEVLETVEEVLVEFQRLGLAELDST
jgi:hypothetical protein